MSSEQEFVAAKEPTAPFEIEPGLPASLAAQVQHYWDEGVEWQPPQPSSALCRNSLARPPKETLTTVPNRADRRAARRGR